MRKIFYTVFLMVQVSWVMGQSVEKINVFTGENYANLLIEVNDITGSVSIDANITKEGEKLWNGQRNLEVYESDGLFYLHLIIKDLSPQLWSPATPVLYDISLSISQNGQLINEAKERVGFRSFESKGGQIYLNSHPIFLRGIAINPPGRGIPGDIERSREFAYDYVRFMKSINVNIIRIPDDEIWYDVCDELGMMVFGGNYSAAVAGKKPPEDYESGITWFKTRKYNKIAHHPSLMIYAITNETAYSGDRAQPWEDFTSYAHKKLRAEWDSSRLYIGNAGYGYGKSGDICDLHRYWGWYYSSPFTFLNIRDNKKIVPFDKPVQPITFTECVGNYSGPDGRYNLTPDHKNPVSQLAWTGHAQQNLQAQLASEHQVFTFKQATELFRRLRVINPELSGIFPFTILFHNWHTIEKFTDMEPKEVAFQAKKSYAPVLLSWEIWTPNVYAGSAFPVRFHIVNDADDFSDLKGARISYELVDGSGKVYFSGEKTLPEVRYYDTYTGSIDVNLPAIMPTGDYHINGTIRNGEETVTTNSYDFFVANHSFTKRTEKKGKVLLYDPSGDTEKSLQQLSIGFTKIKNLSKVDATLLVIGKNALDDKLNYSGIQKYVKNGGRVLVLAQEHDRFEVVNSLVGTEFKNVDMDIDNATYPPPERPSRNGFNVNPERFDHEVFSGINREQLRVWSDYTDWNETQGGMPQIYPVSDGFAMGEKTSLENIAILANYSIGLEGLALVEVFEGKGSFLVSGFDLVRRVGKDPVADKLLVNMLNYMTDEQKHFAHPLINATISWGEYETEKGLLSGINSGFMLNSKPLLTGSYKDKELVVTKEGHLLAERRGGWNNRPGLQYVPYGRRAFGPYYHRGFGGVPEANDYETIGKAEFWCRVEPGKTTMKTLVWNPSAEPLTVKGEVNGSASQQEVAPGKEAWLVINFKPMDNHQIQYEADRRIVFLETVFE